MNADIPLQVWLEASASPPPAIITPYVRSATDTRLRYRIDAFREDQNGRATLRQSGQTMVPAGQATALGHLQLSRTPNDHCEIVVWLLASNATPVEMRFACPDG